MRLDTSSKRIKMIAKTKVLEPDDVSIQHHRALGRLSFSSRLIVALDGSV
jgi:hypothetical protein